MRCATQPTLVHQNERPVRGLVKFGKPHGGFVNRELT